MKPYRGTARPFELCGGHPALDFVNTLDDRFGTQAPEERLSNYGDLLRFAEESHLLDPQQAQALARSVKPAGAARALRSARALREALAAVLYGYLDSQAPASSDLLILEQRFQEADQHRELRWDAAATAAPGQAALHWQWGRGVTAADFPVWLVAQAASQLMLSSALAQVRACGAGTCRWLFLDTSKNHTRRWCNMRVCGNRAKARRFQERHGAT